MAIQKSRSLRNFMSLKLDQPDEQKPAVVASPGPDASIKTPDPQNLISISSREYSGGVTPGEGPAGEQINSTDIQPQPEAEAAPTPAPKPGAPATKPVDPTSEATPDELRRRKLTPRF